MNENLSTNTTTEQPQSKKGVSFFMEILKFAIIATVIVVPLRLYIAQPFVVSGASMDPTFETGEYLIVDQLTYNFEAPKRESVIVFRYPNDTTKFFIKRIIGLPGETVEMHGTQVTIKNAENPKGIILNEKYVAVKNEKTDNFSVTLDSDEYFVMGDNRNGSSDSRIWGPVKMSLIMGRPAVRLLPLSRISFFPGNAQEEF
ncbi:signal peptidase I [Candidatus Parcubacteria bacterium]|nr:signal peptidase I [Candidatus Parcubacteria bacterium]